MGTVPVISTSELFHTKAIITLKYYVRKHKSKEKTYIFVEIARSAFDTRRAQRGHYSSSLSG